MELEIKKWGNSAALRLPTALLEQLNAAFGDKLSVEMRSEGMLLKPKAKKYSLQELLNQCDMDASGPDDMKDWNDISEVGEEKWKSENQ